MFAVVQNKFLCGDFAVSPCFQVQRLFLKKLLVYRTFFQIMEKNKKKQKQKKHPKEDPWL